MITGFLLAVAGGVIALLVEHTYLNFKEKRIQAKQRIVSFPNEGRVIDSSIFSALGPGSTIELAKSVLGVPNKQYQDGMGIFESPEDTVEDTGGEQGVFATVQTETNAYLYLFKNAYVKITSKDKETIDSLTVLTHDKSISMDGLMFPEEDAQNLRFGLTKVTEELVSQCRAEYIRTRRDDSFALTFYWHSPLYRHYTYFGTVDTDKELDITNYSPQDFIGGTIDGVCVSADDSGIYYIYHYELL